jgi:hypothetical protein
MSTNSFQDWWDQLTKAERKVLGEGNAKFVWEEAQKAALAVIESACNAKEAYDAGYAEARAKYLLHLGGYTLTPGVMPGRIWITNAIGEGGDFDVDELCVLVHKFFDERF